MAVNYDGSIRIKADENAASDVRDLSAAADKIDALADSLGEAFGIVGARKTRRFDVEKGAVYFGSDNAEKSGDRAVNTALDNDENRSDNAPRSSISANAVNERTVNLQYSALENTVSQSTGDNSDSALFPAISPNAISGDGLNSEYSSLDNTESQNAGDNSDSELFSAISPNAISGDILNSEYSSLDNTESQKVGDCSDTDLNSETGANAIIVKPSGTKQSNASELTKPRSGTAPQTESFLDGFGEVNSAADSLRILSAPSGYVSAIAGAFAEERNFNIHLNVAGANPGDRAVRTNGASVSVNWHDTMMNNGGGQ